MWTTVCLCYSNISDEESDSASPLYSLLSPKELEWKSCFYKLMTSAALLNILEPEETDHYSRPTRLIYYTIVEFLAI